MRNKNNKCKCIKYKAQKCNEFCRTYSPIQFAYSKLLDSDKSINEFMCNYELKDVESGEYTTDFYIIKNNGDIMIRECVFRKHLSKPLTIKVLDLSRNYWLKHGVVDWGIIIDESK